jgi:hypothetical protein
MGVYADPALLKWFTGEYAKLGMGKLDMGKSCIRCGGHFPGASVLHWAGATDGHGVVCSGDTLTVTPDRKFLSFMRSYPNLIPLGPKTIHRIGAALQPFAFDRIYGHYFDRAIPTGAKAVVEESVARYIAAISD